MGLKNKTSFFGKEKNHRQSGLCLIKRYLKTLTVRIGWTTYKEELGSGVVILPVL